MSFYVLSHTEPVKGLDTLTHFEEYKIENILWF